MITSPITEAMIEISPGGVGLCRLHREGCMAQGRS